MLFIAQIKCTNNTLSSSKQAALLIILLFQLASVCIFLLFCAVFPLCKAHLLSQMSLSLKFLLLGGLGSRISTDGSVGFGVHLFDCIWCNTFFDVLRELPFESIFIRFR